MVQHQLRQASLMEFKKRLQIFKIGIFATFYWFAKTFMFLYEHGAETFCQLDILPTT